MAPSTGPLIIAGLSTIIHFALTLASIYGLISVINGRIIADYINDSGILIILLAISVALETAVLLASICLIVGIQKERPQCIASWLYLTAAYMILSIADSIGGYNTLGHLFAIKIAVFMLHGVMWYPIFKCWQELR